MSPTTEAEDCESIARVLMSGPGAWPPEARRLLAALVAYGPPGEGVVYGLPAERDLEDKRDGMRSLWTKEGAARASALHTWQEVALALGMTWPLKAESAKVAEAREGLARAFGADAELAEAQRLREAWRDGWPGTRELRPWAALGVPARTRWLALARDSLARARGTAK